MVKREKPIHRNRHGCKSKIKETLARLFTRSKSETEVARGRLGGELEGNALLPFDTVSVLTAVKPRGAQHALSSKTEEQKKPDVFCPVPQQHCR